MALGPCFSPGVGAACGCGAEGRVLQVGVSEGRGVCCHGERWRLRSLLRTFLPTGVSRVRAGTCGQVVSWYGAPFPRQCSVDFGLDLSPPGNGG